MRPALCPDVDSTIFSPLSPNDRVAGIQRQVPENVQSLLGAVEHLELIVGERGPPVEWDDVDAPSVCE